MSSKSLVLIIFMIVGLISCDFDCDDVTKSHLILNTLSGRVKGLCEDTFIYFSNKTNKNVALLNWLGVPFAEPPVGKLRFNKPQPIKPWSNIRNGTELPNRCIQQTNDDSDDSEDCLYLSIYSPYNSYLKSVIQNEKSSLLPIFVWIHGGSYIEGSGAEYDPSMISAFSNIVSVTINYRLGGLSFLHLSGTNASGNLLLFDQQLAMKWIYENADKFGGDRNKITICGESAGSTSVGYHLLFKSSWPFYKNVILQSGIPIPDFGDHYTPEQADDLTKKIASKVGCDSKLSNQKILECLQSTNAFNLNKITIDTILFPVIVYDKDLFLEQPTTLYRKGEFKKDGNILIGYTNLEQLSLAYIEIDKEEIDKLKNGDYALFEEVIKDRLSLNDDQYEKVVQYYLAVTQINNKNIDYFYHYVIIVSDYEYRCPTHLFAELASKHNKNIYAYSYEHKSSTSEYPSIFDGAAHAEELEFMFAEPLFEENLYDSNEKLFSEQMVNYWTNFVKFDTPSSNYEWPRYKDTNSISNRNLFLLRMNQNKKIIYKTTDSICSFWTDLGVYSED